MKKLKRNSTHERGRSHDCLIVEYKDHKLKLTYEAYNAAERCRIAIFDSLKWNIMFTLRDTGETPERGAYVWSDEIRKKRADDLFAKLTRLAKTVL